jgi:hypothetical protein
MAIALVVAAPVRAQAPDEEGLAFLDSRPLTLDAARTPQLCNVGSEAATDPEVRLTGFGFARPDAAPVPPADVIEVSSLPDSIAPGTCPELTVKLRPGATLGSGKYEGVLAVTAPRAGVARLAVTVDVAPTAATPAGATETAALEAVRFGWGGDAHLDDDARYLPLDQPTGKKELNVGAGCEDEEPDPGDTSECFLGTVFNGPERALVYAAGPVRARGDGPALLPLRVQDVGEAGEYEGTLTLGPGAEVKVKLTVRSGVGSAILALVLGAVIAILLQLWGARWRPLFDLARRRAKLPRLYSEAGTAVQSCMPGFSPPAADVIATYTEKVRAEVKKYRRSTLLFDTASDAYKEIDKSLRLAEDDADFLKRDDGFCRALQDLTAKLEELRATPAVARTGASLLKPQPLGIGDATERARKATAHCELIDEWIALARRREAHQRWYLALEAQSANMDEADQRRLEDVRAKLDEVRAELMEVKDAAELAAVRTASEVQSLYHELAYLGSRYGVPHPGDRADVESARFPGETVADLVERALGARVRAAKPAGMIGTWRSIGDAVAFAVSVAIAIATGLAAFYFGEAWGTFEDFVTVVLVGTAATALSKAILDGLTRFWVRDSVAPSAVKPAEEAVVEPAAP